MTDTDPKLVETIHLKTTQCAGGDYVYMEEGGISGDTFYFYAYSSSTPDCYFKHTTGLGGAFTDTPASFVPNRIEPDTGGANDPRFTQGGGFGQTETWYGSNNLTSGTLEVWDGNQYSGDIENIFFEMTDSIPPATSNSVQIDFPNNGYSGDDFQTWGASVESLYSTAIVQINYGNSTSSFPYYGGIMNIDYAGNFVFSTSTSPYFLKISATTPGTYYAQAYLETCPVDLDLYTDCIPSIWPGNSPSPNTGLFDVWATSTPIAFTITGQSTSTQGYFIGNTFYPDLSAPTSTASSTEWVMTCDPNDPLWSKSLCQITNWLLSGLFAMLKALFIPSQNIFDKFTNLIQAIAPKPPIGYFFAIKDIISGVGATSTATFVLPGVASLGTFFDPIKTGISFLLWFGFIFWIFNRVRHLDI